MDSGCIAFDFGECIQKGKSRHENESRKRQDHHANWIDGALSGLCGFQCCFVRLFHFPHCYLGFHVFNFGL